MKSNRNIGRAVKQVICALLVMVSLFTPVTSALPGASFWGSEVTAEAANWQTRTFTETVKIGSWKSTWTLKVKFNQTPKKGAEETLKVYAKGPGIKKIIPCIYNQSGKITMKTNWKDGNSFQNGSWATYKVKGTQKGYAGLCFTIYAQSGVSPSYKTCSISFHIT